MELISKKILPEEKRINYNKLNLISTDDEENALKGLTMTSLRLALVNYHKALSALEAHYVEIYSRLDKLSSTKNIKRRPPTTAGWAIVNDTIQDGRIAHVAQEIIGDGLQEFAVDRINNDEEE